MEHTEYNVEYPKKQVDPKLQTKLGFKYKTETEVWLFLEETSSDWHLPKPIQINLRKRVLLKINTRGPA